MTPELATIADTRRIMSLGQTKLYELINSGQLQTIKIGRRRLVRTDSIRQLIDTSAAA